MVLEDASGDWDMYALSTVIFIDMGREVGKPVVILPTVGGGVVWVSAVLTAAKGSVVKSVNECAGVASEVRTADFDISTGEEVITWGVLDTVAGGEPEGKVDKIQASIDELVASESIDPEVAPEGFHASVVPGVTDVAVFSNVCLISAKVMGVDLEDIGDEGLSDIPKVGRIPDVESDDCAITSPDTRPV